MARLKQKETKVEALNKFTKVDYNELFNKITDKNRLNEILNFISNKKLKIEPTKEQYLKIKNNIDEYENIACDNLELRFISNYNDYIDKTFSDDEKEEFFLSIFKKKAITKNISKVLNSNLVYLKNELIFKIIDLLIKKIEKSPKHEEFYYYSFTILNYLLFLKKNRNESTTTTASTTSNEINKLINEKEIKIKKILNLKFKIITENDGLNLNSKRLNSFEVMDYFLELLENENKNFKNKLIYYSILKKLLITRNKIKGNEIDLLKFIRKYNNEIVECIVDESRFNVKGLGESFVKQVTQILLDNCQFDIDSNFISLQAKEPNFLQHDPSITFDVLMEIYKLMYCDFKFIGKRRLEDAIYNSILVNENKVFEINQTNPKTILSIYKINENTFIKNLQQNELLLLEIYNNFFKIVVTNFDIECLVPYFFHLIQDSPTKLCFLKSKLNYLLEACNINIINHWILPHFPLECQQSSVYQMKVSQSATLSTIGNGEKRIPNIIWNEILLRYLDSNSTSMYQKLQISMVSKYFYSKTVDIINNSISIPIVISSSRYFFTSNSSYVLSERKSLLKPNRVKFIKFYYKSTVDLGLKNKELELNHLLNQCKSIEIFHLKALDEDYSGSFFIQVFNYLNWYGPKLSKFVINSPVEECYYDGATEEQTKNSVINLFKAYKEKFEGKVQTILNVDIYDSLEVEERKLIDFSIVNKLRCPISQYFEQGFLKMNSVQNIEYLKFNIDHYFMENEKILKYFRKYATNHSMNENALITNEPSLGNLRKLHLEIESTSKFVFNTFNLLFRFLGNKISNKFNEIEISLIKLKEVPFLHILEVIFKVISSNRCFDNVNQITISNYFNVYNQNHWSSINSYSFNQKPYPQFKLHSIEFFRSTDLLNDQDIKSNKRKLDEINTISGKEEIEDDEDDDYQLDFDSDSMDGEDYDSDDSDDSDDDEDDEEDEE